MKLIIKSAAAVFLSLILVPGCNENKPDEHKNHTESRNPDFVKISDTSIKEIGLDVDVVTLKPFTGYISIPAKVIVNQDNEAQVGSLIQGRVERVLVKEGDYVKSGQILMYVEGLEIGEIKAAYLSAKAELDYHKTDFERQKSLIEQNIGSQKSFLEAKAEYEKAFAGFNAQDKKIHSIGLTDEDILDKNGNDHTSGTLPVKSPISGVVVERNVVIGQLAEGTTNAFKIINTGTVWVDGQLHEKDINKINEKSSVLFSSSAFPEKKFKGKIEYIGQTINENSRTITIRAEFKNPKGELKPQMFGEMQIPAGENAGSILIPLESIIKIDNQDFVFVQKDSENFEKRAVTAGSIIDDLVEIKNGLKENEMVVVKGGFYLKSELLKDLLEEDEH